MNDDRLTILVEKYLNGSCTHDEQRELEVWYESLEANKINYYKGDKKAIDAASRRSLVAIHRNMETSTGFYAWHKMAAAAVLLITFGLGIYAYHSGKFQRHRAPIALIGDVLPGGNKAVLKLADGRSVNLKEDQQAIVVTPEKISYGNGRELIKNRQAIHGNEKQKLESTMMSLTTPKGGRYQVILADGTKVWLNAQSTLKYPSVFPADNRVVELSGEAYFQVAGDAALSPFLVRTKGQEVRVLGTEFNISSYEFDHEVATTLVKGAVQVLINATSDARILKPGQCALTEMDNGKLSVFAANIEEATSWKNNYFKFTEEDIRTIMAKLARWYDVDVKYDKGLDLGKLYFSGTVSCQKSLRDALRIMELTGTVHFKIEGREVTVM